MARRLTFLVLLLTSAAWCAEIRGKVVNARGGEPLERVRVSLLEAQMATITAADGSFSLGNVPPGSYTLRVDAVGFWLQKIAVEVTAADQVKDFSITLSSEGLRRTDTVEVRGDIFHGVETAGADQITVTAEELKSTATVAAADPFRTVQVLPGVTSASNNDFFAEFNVLGAPFSAIGIYVDDVQLRNPVHGIPGFEDSASISVLNGDTIESLTLTPTGFSERYADSTGAALDIRTREGSRTTPQFRIAASMMETHGTAEGSLGHKRGSWLLAARKSYLGYIVRASGVANAPSVGFYDTDAKLTYDLTNRHTLDLYARNGEVSLDRTHERNAQLDDNSLTFGTNAITLGRIVWRYTASSRLLFSSHAAYIREQLKTSNPLRQSLDRNHYGEWVGGTTAVWSWKPDHILETGYDLRRLRQGNRSSYYDGLDVFGEYQSTRATALRHGGYVQQSSALFSKRLHVLAGLRWDRLSRIGPQPVSPQASASFRVAASTELQFGFGRYLQFSRIFGQQLDSADVEPSWQCDHAGPMFDRSTHYLVAVEQRVGEHSRVRVEAFHRADQTEYGSGPIVDGGSGCGPYEPIDRSQLPSTRQYSRGFQIVLQRRSANRLAGWIGYTLDYARSVTTAPKTPGPIPYPTALIGTFPTWLDQRHTLNAFGSYRFKPTVSFSGKLMYGSGYPISASLRKTGGDYFLDITKPSFVYMPRYARLDLRLDKVFALRSRKLTLSVEVLNATNHRNMRFLGYDNYDPNTGRVFLVLDRALPLAPTAGLAFEF